jgi:high-affinity iron transporter
MIVGSFLLALREGLEAALVIGIAFSVLRRLGKANLGGVLWLGAACGAALSALIALVLTLIGAEFEGQGEELFEGFTMLLAAGMITWLILWVHREGRGARQQMEAGVRRAVTGGGKLSVFLVAFLAVLREGVELALFLMAARLASNPLETWAGALSGLASAGLLGWLLFTASRRLSLRVFFQATNILLLVFAAGLVGMAVHEFNEAGWIPPIIEQVWDLTPVLPDKAGIGQLLHALVGYDANPSLASIIAYVGYLLLLVLILRRPRQAVAEGAPG